MESKCHETLRRISMGQKHMGVLRAEYKPPGRARRARGALVGCAHLGCPRTASLLYKYPNIPKTIVKPMKY